MTPRARRRWRMELLEDRAAPALVRIVDPAVERALDFTCSFFDALTPFARPATLAFPVSASPSMFINDFVIDLAPDWSYDYIAVRRAG